MRGIRKAVIPAAGLGTRMLPATKTVPKEMLPLAGRPVIQYAVEEAAAAGLREILIVTGRGKEALENYFDRAPELEARLAAEGKTRELEQVRRVTELAHVFFARQGEPLGLGHAILCARAFVGDEPFAVLLPDDVILSRRPAVGQLADAALRYDSAVIGVQKMPAGELCRYGSPRVEPAAEHLFSVSDLIEKPLPGQELSPYAVLGRYILTPSVFPLLEVQAPGRNGELQLTDALRSLCRSEPVLALEFSGRRYDAGTPEGYLAAETELAAGLARG